VDGDIDLRSRCYAVTSVEVVSHRQHLLVSRIYPVHFRDAEVVAFRDSTMWPASAVTRVCGWESGHNCLLLLHALLPSDAAHTSTCSISNGLLPGQDELQPALPDTESVPVELPASPRDAVGSNWLRHFLRRWLRQWLTPSCQQ
jgi:hypothetical protein